MAEAAHADRTRLELQESDRPLLMKRRSPVITIDADRRVVELENVGEIRRLRHWYFPARVDRAEIAFSDLRAVRIVPIRHRPRLLSCMLQTQERLYNLTISAQWIEVFAGLRGLTLENPVLPPEEHVDVRIRRVFWITLAFTFGLMAVLVLLALLVVILVLPSSPAP